ncbi:MAG: xanthine dehydrogenase family protein subunit M [bacterium]|jgi:CO/xanthine dehydrogenase FAD-binding subunit|nr:xanthine dehydrogenase family protein subunit M [bacterium]
MRGAAVDLEIRRPFSLAQALDLLADEAAGWTLLCGGTDVMVLHEAGLLGPRRLLDLWGLPGLCGIAVEPESVVIGAATPFAEIRDHGRIRAEFPLLAEAARNIGARAIQERGSLGGNLGNASPAADSVPALIAHGAELELASRRGRRRLAVEDFFLDYRRTALAPGEVIHSIHLPRPGAPVAWFRKVGARRAQAISKVVLAAAGAWREGRLHCRIGLGSVAPIPLRCRETENYLAFHAGETGWQDEAVARLQDEIRPIDDIRSTAAYRRRVAGNLLLAFLRRAGETG